MSDIDALIQEIRAARQRYLSAVRSLSPEQAHFKPAPQVWSAVENTSTSPVQSRAASTGCGRQSKASRPAIPSGRASHRTREKRSSRSSPGPGGRRKRCRRSPHPPGVGPSATGSRLWRRTSTFWRRSDMRSRSMRWRRYTIRIRSPVRSTCGSGWSSCDFIWIDIAARSRH